MKDLIIFGDKETQGRIMDSELWVPADKVAALMGYIARDHPLGTRIVENVVPIDTSWGNYRGILVGTAVYGPMHPLLVAAGYKVQRIPGPGAGQLWVRR